jgi:antitoxin Phd
MLGYLFLVFYTKLYLVRLVRLVRIGMMETWQLQNAKAHLSELVKKATSGEPQEITLRGNPAVVVLSIQQYKKLKRPKQKLTEFLRQSPLAGITINTERDKTSMRDIEL